jgi:alpha-tubulin suppressor-like RCC1 family protein
MKDYLIREEENNMGITTTFATNASMTLTRRIVGGGGDSSIAYFTEAFIHLSLRKLYLLFMGIERHVQFNDDIYIEIIKKMVAIDFERHSTTTMNNPFTHTFIDSVTNKPISRVIQLSRNDHRFCIILTADGKLYGNGENDKGQLGIGTFYDAHQDDDEEVDDDDHLFTCLTHDMNNQSLPRAYKVFCKDESTMMITEEGLLYACGDNAYGKLGFGDTVNRSRLEHVKYDKDGNLMPCIRDVINISIIVSDKGDQWICGGDHGHQSSSKYGKMLVYEQ